MAVQPVVLLVFAAINTLFAYFTGVLVARELGAEGYDEYVVAIAAVSILSTVAELGIGKLAMRLVPVFHVRERWGLARGYVRFSFITVLVSSVALVLLFGVPTLAGEGGRRSDSLLLALAFLPAIALVGFGAEMIQANQATLRSAAVTRLFVPAVSFFGVVVWSATHELSARAALFLFGVSWVAGLGLTRYFMWQSTPREVVAAPIEVRPRRWLGRAMPFLCFALLVIGVPKAGVIVMGIVAPDIEVSIYAAAFETATFLSLVGKSTDKMYLPRAAIVIEGGDVAYGLRLANRRLRVIGAICVVFFAGTLAFGREVLMLFGEEFAQGHLALIIMTFATGVWVLFSVAPSVLQYLGANSFVLISMTVTLVLVIVLTAILGSLYGVLGGAIAYAVPVTILFPLFSLRARSLFAKRMAERAQEGRA